MILELLSSEFYCKLCTFNKIGTLSDLVACGDKGQVTLKPSLKPFHGFGHETMAVEGTL